MGPCKLSTLSGLLGTIRASEGLFGLISWVGCIFGDPWQSIPKGPRTKKTRFSGPDTLILMVFGPETPIMWVLGPLGYENTEALTVLSCFR